MDASKHLKTLNLNSPNSFFNDSNSLHGFPWLIRYKWKSTHFFFSSLLFKIAPWN